MTEEAKNLESGSSKFKSYLRHHMNLQGMFQVPGTQEHTGMPGVAPPSMHFYFAPSSLRGRGSPPPSETTLVVLISSSLGSEGISSLSVFSIPLFKPNSSPSKQYPILLSYLTSDFPHSLSLYPLSPNLTPLSLHHLPPNYLCLFIHKLPIL